MLQSPIRSVEYYGILLEVYSDVFVYGCVGSGCVLCVLLHLPQDFH